MREDEQATRPGATDGPQEISIQARWCSRTRVHTVGDVLMFQSAIWTVKGLYFGATPSGDRELYYILSESAVPPQRVRNP